MTMPARSRQTSEMGEDSVIARASGGSAAVTDAMGDPNRPRVGQVRTLRQYSSGAVASLHRSRSARCAATLRQTARPPSTNRMRINSFFTEPVPPTSIPRVVGARVVRATRDSLPPTQTQRPLHTNVQGPYVDRRGGTW